MHGYPYWPYGGMQMRGSNPWPWLNMPQPEPRIIFVHGNGQPPRMPPIVGYGDDGEDDDDDFDEDEEAEYLEEEVTVSGLDPKDVLNRLNVLRGEAAELCIKVHKFMEEVVQHIDDAE